MEQSSGASFERTQLCFTKQRSYWKVTLGYDLMCLVTVVYVGGFIQLQMNEACKAATGTFLDLLIFSTTKVILNAVRG